MAYRDPRTGFIFFPDDRLFCLGFADGPKSGLLLAPDGYTGDFRRGDHSLEINWSIPRRQDVRRALHVMRASSLKEARDAINDTLDELFDALYALARMVGFFLNHKPAMSVLQVVHLCAYFYPEFRDRLNQFMARMRAMALDKDRRLPLPQSIPPEFSDLDLLWTPRRTDIDVDDEDAYIRSTSAEIVAFDATVRGLRDRVDELLVQDYVFKRAASISFPRQSFPLPVLQQNLMLYNRGNAVPVINNKRFIGCYDFSRVSVMRAAMDRSTLFKAQGPWRITQRAEAAACDALTKMAAHIFKTQPRAHVDFLRALVWDCKGDVELERLRRVLIGCAEEHMASALAAASVTKKKMSLSCVVGLVQNPLPRRSRLLSTCK